MCLSAVAERRATTPHTHTDAAQAGVQVLSMAAHTRVLTTATLVRDSGGIRYCTSPCRPPYCVLTLARTAAHGFQHNAIFDGRFGWTHNQTSVRNHADHYYSYGCGLKPRSGRPGASIWRTCAGRACTPWLQALRWMRSTRVWAHLCLTGEHQRQHQRQRQHQHQYISTSTSTSTSTPALA